MMMMNDNNISGSSKKRPINLVDDDHDDDAVVVEQQKCFALPIDLWRHVCHYATARRYVTAARLAQVSRAMNAALGASPQEFKQRRDKVRRRHRVLRGMAPTLPRARTQDVEEELAHTLWQQVAFNATIDYDGEHDVDATASMLSIDVVSSGDDDGHTLLWIDDKTVGPSVTLRLEPRRHTVVDSRQQLAKRITDVVRSMHKTIEQGARARHDR